MTELLTYDSQEAEYFKDKNVFKININGPFHSAGSQYKWREFWGKEGIGINKRLIDLANKLDSRILIYLGTREYFIIEAWIIKDFCEKTNSIFKKKVQNKEIILYVFPTNNLNRLPIIKPEEIQAKIN